MAEKLTLDANVLVYALDSRDPLRQSIASAVIAASLHINTALTTVALGEFYNASVRKLAVAKALALGHLQNYVTLFPVLSYDGSDTLRGARENEAGRFQFWDAVMLSAAERAGCTVCLSEDMTDGAKLGGITVRNPFGTKGLSAAARAALSP